VAKSLGRFFGNALKNPRLPDLPKLPKSSHLPPIGVNTACPDPGAAVARGRRPRRPVTIRLRAWWEDQA
jgi:hypothetical protein